MRVFNGNLLKSTVLALGMSLLAGCATGPSAPPLSKQQVFTGIYTEKPVSVLVLPAINHSTAADAPLLYTASIAQPLTEQGYYVLPVPITNTLLQQGGISDGAQLLAVPPQRFGQMFGADSVLYVTINSWDTAYYVVGGHVTVSLSFKLVSTRTSESLWQFQRTVTIDTGGNANNGLIAALVETAIKTAQQDYFPIAQQVNYASVSVLPHGKFHSQHGLDAAHASQAEFNQLADDSE